MKYYEVKFRIQCEKSLVDDVRDVLSAMAGEAGFETFEETAEGLIGYVQQPLFDREMLDTMLDVMPFNDCAVDYEVEEAEDRDWNEEWEQQGFDPIAIEDRLIIHDGRHLPREGGMSPMGPMSPMSPMGPMGHISPILIEIDAHLAFGTGNHQTTRMICATLLKLDLGGCRVLDCGTGTGILAIAALKLGACDALGYDIDEWSVDNARHKAVINHVDDRFQSLLGDSSFLEESSETFGLVMANINRNILLNDLPRFRSVMTVDGWLILSGFYAADVPLLTERAASLGLKVVSQQVEDDWACLLLQAV